MSWKPHRHDLEILSLLQHDARLSVGDVADRVGMSKSACWRRIQALEEAGVIRQRVTLLNPEALGLPLSVFIAIRTNQHSDKWANRFKALIADIPEVLEVYRMSGDLDYMVRAVVPDMPGYDALYKRMIKIELFDVSASFVMETMKYTTELPLREVL